MSVVGIIAEYNPFHSGHEYLLNQARLLAQNDPIIVIMSGNYVQRGDISLLDKWQRAKSALASGADLVFELPFAYAVQPADIFAEGAMKLLQAAGVTDLVFGTEDENLNFNYLGDKIVEMQEHHVDFQDYTNTYATQYNQMVAREVGRELNQPNMLLGVSYAVSNAKLGYPMRLHPVKRIGQDHEVELVDDGVVMSATAIRNYILQNGATNRLAEWLPPVEVKELNDMLVFPTWNMMFDYLRYKLESTSAADLRQLYQMSEGLEHKMKNEITFQHNFTEFLKAIKSKRYTYARLRRTCLYAVLNIKEAEMTSAREQASLFLLGYSKIGKSYLKKYRKKFTKKVISKVDGKLAKSEMLALQIRVDRFYEQLTQTNQNFGRKPVEVK